MRLPSGLRALGHRDYRVYYSGQLVALTGSWMQTVAQSWLVLQLTDSPLLLGLISTLQFGPLLLFSVLSGAVADRLPRRRVLVATQSTQGCLALVLALLVATGHVQYWHVALVAVSWGLANALDQPSRQSFVVDLVGRNDVVSAIGLHSAAFNGTRILGPAAAGLLIARVGIAPAFALNGAAFAIAVAALLQLRARGEPVRGATTTMLEQMAEGLAFVLRTPDVRLVLGLQVVLSFCVFNFGVYIPLLARQVLGLGAQGFGFLMAALGVGAVVAALGLGSFSTRQPPVRLLALALGLACLGLLGLAAARHFWMAAALLAAVGFTATLVGAGCNAWCQMLAPDALRGRMMSVYILLSSGIFPVSAFWTGFVSEHRGVSTAFLVNGSLGLTALTAILVWRRLRAPADAA